jgi:hypothetical protein
MIAFAYQLTALTALTTILCAIGLGLVLVLMGFAP